MRLIDKLRDSITLVIIAGVLLGCYATTRRTARALDPGQASGGASYMRFSNSGSDNPGELIALDGRVGVGKGIDLGMMRTIDISSGLEDDEGVDTFWFDSKFQLTNRSNELNKPTLALGYGFGNVLNSEDDAWVNMLYLIWGVETKSASLYYSFRYEIIDDHINLVPTWTWQEEFANVRKAHVFGLEINAHRRVKPVVELGRFWLDDFGDGLNVMTAGLNLYSK